MKVAKIVTGSALALSAVLAATQASAQAFVGGSIGQSDIENSIATSGPNGPLITSGTVDGKDTAFKVFGGYMFNQHFGVEGAYVNLGEASYSGTFFGLPVTGGTVEVTGLNVAALGSYPVTPEFSVFGKIGLFVWESNASDTTGGLPFSNTADGTDLSFGIGVGYSFTRNLGVRAEWERFKLDNVDADLLSIGLVYKF
ncbi:MAG: outer membrane beta-barrel protein [Burkholderiales bacterium]